MNKNYIFFDNESPGPAFCPSRNAIKKTTISIRDVKQVIYLAHIYSSIVFSAEGEIT